MIDDLPPREREILLLLYRRGGASPSEIAKALPERLSAQATRTMLSRLEKKGFVTRRAIGRGFLYSPSEPKLQARRSMLGRVVDVFFGGSAVGAATALLGDPSELKDDELDELERMIAEARRARSGSSVAKR